MKVLLLGLMMLLLTPFLTAAEKVRASYYHHKFTGRKTANGEVYDPEKLTAAHRSFKFGTWLRLFCPTTKKSVQVKVNDRGPYSNKFKLDLSEAAARALGITPRMGWAWVEVTEK